MHELPEGWEPRTLRDAALPGREGFIDGDWIEAPYLTDAGIRLIQTGNLGVGTFIDKPETRKYISAASHRLLNCTSVNAGDVLICRLADPIGRACEVPASVGEAITAVDCTITRVDQSKFDKSFLLHWLNSDHNLKAAADMAAGSTRSRISRSNLGKLSLPRPPLNEQAAIGKALDTLDTTIRQTEAIIEKLKQVKQGLLHDLLTRGIDANGELRPPQSQAPHLYKRSPLGWIPKEWAPHALGQVLIGGTRNGLYRPSSFHGSGSLMVQMGGMFRGEAVDFNSATRVRVTRSELSTFGLEVGDLLFARRSLTFEGAGQCAIVRKLPEASTFESSIVRARVDRSRVEPEFAALFLRGALSSAHRRTLIRQVAVSGVSSDDIAHFLIALPQPVEQAAIIDAIASVQDRIERETVEAHKLSRQKSGLMDDLLTGRVRVTPLLEASS